MKISKLFHWLYAILMFLPIMVFIPNAFYYGFNEHAVAQEKTEQVPVYYETNEVNSVDDLISNHIYTFELPSTSIRYDNSFNIGCYDFFLISGNFVNYSYPSPTRPTPYISHFDYSITSESLLVYSNEISFRASGLYTIDFIFRNVNTWSSTLLGIIKECPRQYVKEYQPLTTNMSITDSMSYAWDSTWQNDLFSWSYDSFLTQPFLYITNLFNVPATNTLVYCLSYWLNISIIWLVFDVIMYVPLLVHRWLDKGIVE